MPPKRSSEVKFEIGHVLFIDIVGYSKLLIHEQSERIQKLKEIACATEQCRLAEAEGKLLRLPTGDGAALVFRNSLEAPVMCAMEIAKALKNSPELQLRMGIHSGPVNEVVDLNEQANITGPCINIAQRVMDCGDAGHIIISKRVADDLEQYPRWRPYLHEIGECKVKHGEIISLVNFYTAELGNPRRPQKIRGAAPSKSVAVLPFVNMSADKHDEYLSDGMTEELINALARVPGLRVPGRTSCFAFKGKSEEGIYAYMGSVVMPEKDAIAKEKEFAQKALELDPELAEAHMSLALALVAAFDWRNALKEFDRALELNPNLAFAYELQAWTVNGLGRFDEAIAKTKKAVELDPLNPFFQMSLSFFLYWARQYDDAIAQARKTLAMDPNSAISHVLLGLSFLKKGDTVGAIAEFQKVKVPNPGAWYQGYFGYAFAISGDRAKAEQALRELEELAKRQYVSPTTFVTIYLGLGEKEKALDWLEKAYEEQDSACWYLNIDQIYDSVRNEPRFQALVQKIFREAP